MQKKINYIFCLFLLIIGSHFYCQIKIDTVLFNKKYKKINKLLETKVDSAFPLINQNLVNTLRQKYANGYSKSNLQLARYYTLKGFNDSAILYTPIAIKYARVSKDSALIVNSYLSHARVLANTANYNEAVENCLLAQRFAEGLKDSKLNIKVFHDLGYVYSNIGTIQKAIIYYKKGLAIAKLNNDTFNIANITARIGGEFNTLGKYDSSLYYGKIGLYNFKLIKHKRGIGATLTNLAATYNSLKQVDKAIEITNEALKIRTELGDDYAITILKNNLTQCYIDKKEYTKALQIGKEAELLNAKQNDLSLQTENYACLKTIYHQLKQNDLAYVYANKYILLKDSFYNKTNLKALGELQAKYENDKQEKEITLLQLEKKNVEEKTEAENKRSNIILISITSVLALIIVFAIMLYKRFKQSIKQKQIIEKQKQLVDEKQKEIIDSINYALTIQQAIIPTEEDLKLETKNACVFFKPKDIVSGDFYWYSKLNNYLFIAVADCTGHGVPGAFMSLMGISYLSEIINENKIIDTDIILNNLRSKVISNLNKTTNTKAKSDGMDIVIIRINTATLQLQFSGANNTIYIIQNSQLSELKGNKMPVGLYTDVLKPFTKTELQLNKGDKLFATTDGLPDQFGGPKGKKFMYKQLEQLLSSEPNLLQLKKNIISNFETWKGNNEQIDDITFVGIEF